MTLPSLDAEADISIVYARVAQAVTLLLLLISYDLMRLCQAIIMESKYARHAMTSLSCEEVAPMVRKGDHQAAAVEQSASGKENMSNAAFCPVTAVPHSSMPAQYSRAQKQLLIHTADHMSMARML